MKFVTASLLVGISFFTASFTQAMVLRSTPLSKEFAASVTNDESLVSEESSDELPSLTITETQVLDSELSDDTLIIAPIEESTPSMAYRGSRVTETQLTLFGRGNYNPKSHEILTLACVGELESKDSALRKCDLLQFVLVDANKQATWASDSFFYGSKKAFKKRMRHIEQYSRAHSVFSSDLKQLPGFVIALGGAAALVATVSTGAGIGFFAIVAWLLAVKHKNWQAIDFITPLPRLLVSSLNARPFLATADQRGWSWAEHPVRMRAKKFDRLKEMLTYRDRLPE